MQIYTNKQYNTVFYKLPREIQDVVASASTTEAIRKVGDKHKLQLDQIDALINIVLDVLMGMIASKDITNEVVENCKIPRMEASMVIKDLDDEIFKPVKELMMRLYSEGAPFKPATMKTVDENDEDHIHLDPKQILREIEDPVPHEVKQEVATVSKIAPKIDGVGSPSLKASTSKVLEEYHTEISLGKKIDIVNEPLKSDLRSTTPTGISNIEESKKRLLESIASQKLSGVFTMPKVADDTLSSLPKRRVEEPVLTSTNISTNIKEELPKPIQKTEEKGVKSSDPYREAIN